MHEIVHVSDAKIGAISGVTQLETVMALPKVVVRGKQVILLSGFKDCDTGKKGGTDTMRPGVIVNAKDELALAAQRNPDAVAFGYIAGQWVASA